MGTKLSYLTQQAVGGPLADVPTEPVVIPVLEPQMPADIASDVPLGLTRNDQPVKHEGGSAEARAGEAPLWADGWLITQKSDGVTIERSPSRPSNAVQAAGAINLKLEGLSVVMVPASLDEQPPAAPEPLPSSEEPQQVPVTAEAADAALAAEEAT